MTTREADRRPAPGRPTSGGYVPERGDVVWRDFDPRDGREQAKRRPAVVLSPASAGTRGMRVPAET